MQDKVIDIHCHILPGIDDGPHSLDESIAMVRQAVAQGVGVIIATPHYIPDEIEYNKEIIYDKVKLLQSKIDSEGIDCKIYTGMELYLTPQLIKHFDDNKIVTLAESKYVLVEFPIREGSSNLINLLHEIKIRGYNPIVAHPEKNMAILENPSLINQILEHKVLLQVNANSITGCGGPKIQKLAKDFVAQNLVSFVASDAHSLDRRPFCAEASIAALKKIVKPDVIQKMVHGNGEKILNNIKIYNDTIYSVKESGDSKLRKLLGFGKIF